MKFENTDAGLGSPGQIETPRCTRCDMAMRHSCTEEATSAGEEHRIYECVKCGHTQSVTTSAA